MAINAKRLLKLADYLETVPREKFDMGSWGRGRGCGFSGCALGWASHGELFSGLKSGFAGPKYAGECGHNAAAELFGMSPHESVALFGSEQHGTPKQVAKRIRKFVRDNQASAP